MNEYILLSAGIALNAVGLAYSIKNIVRKNPARFTPECCCQRCVYFEPFEKVEDFDGFCHARSCQTDKLDFCNYATRRKTDE